MERLGPTWRFLKTDLAALAAHDHAHRELLETMASSLKLLGKLLMPEFGTAAVNNITRPRPASQDIMFLLAMLADKNGACEGEDARPNPKAASNGKSKGKNNQVEKVADPVYSLDPWARGVNLSLPVVDNTAKIVADPAVQHIAVEKITEEPDVKPQSSTVSTQTDTVEDPANMCDTMQTDVVTGGRDQGTQWEPSLLSDFESMVLEGAEALDKHLGYEGDPLQRPELKRRAVFLFECGHLVEDDTARCIEHNTLIDGIRCGDSLRRLCGHSWSFVGSNGRTYHSEKNIVRIESIQDKNGKVSVSCPATGRNGTLHLVNFLFHIESG